MIALLSPAKTAALASMELESTHAFASMDSVANTASRTWMSALPVRAATAPLVETTSTRTLVRVRWVSPAPIVRPMTKIVRLVPV